jgi:CBS domain-containing protein
MRVKMQTTLAPHLTLEVETAAELMQPNPISIRDDATIQEAIALLSDKGFSAAPVINRAGHPVGVVSRFDILVHDREKSDYLVPELGEDEEVHARTGKFKGGGFQVIDVDRTPVSEIMTPIVFSVSPEAPAHEVVEKLISLKVHRLFVVDGNGVLVGVISTTDVLRHLR